VDFDTPNARNASGRGRRTATFKYYEIPDNLWLRVANASAVGCESRTPVLYVHQMLSENANDKSGPLVGLADLIRAVGGALLAFFAVLVLLILAWAKLDDLAEAARGEAFVAVVGAISTIVGGYVGVKIGASGTENAAQGQKAAEKAKDLAKSDVAVLLGKLPKEEADSARSELKSI
jgi:hypothetical protein